jgi:hypothetical protein
MIFLNYRDAFFHSSLKYCLKESAVSLFFIRITVGSSCMIVITVVVPMTVISVGVF